MMQSKTDTVVIKPLHGLLTFREYMDNYAANPQYYLGQLNADICYNRYNVIK